MTAAVVFPLLLARYNSQSKIRCRRRDHYRHFPLASGFSELAHVLASETSVCSCRQWIVAPVELQAGCGIAGWRRFLEKP
jgi:hypothetical protein